MDILAKASIKTLKKRRIKRYQEAFKNIDADKMAVIEKMILCAVDLEFQIDEIKEKLIQTGFVEEYRNGQNQYGTKESTASKAYNTALKNYNSLIRTLLSCMPEAQSNETDDGFEAFLKQRNHQAEL